MAVKKANVRRVTRKRRESVEPIIASTDKMLDRYAALARTSLNGNLRLATRAQRLLAEFASASAKSRPEDLDNAWARWVEFGMSAYDSYVLQSLAYWDHVLTAAETSVTRAARQPAPRTRRPPTPKRRRKAAA